MSATESEYHPEIRKIKKVRKIRKERDEDLPGDGPAPLWNEAARRALALRLMEQLDEGVEAANALAVDPGFNFPEERVTQVLTLARITSANANLGRAITQLIQVEQKRRTIIEHVAPVSNDSNFKQEGEIAVAITKKMFRYLKILTDETLDPAIQEAEVADAIKARDARYRDQIDSAT
jgi:hypothetical protein